MEKQELKIEKQSEEEWLKLLGKKQEYPEELIEKRFIDEIKLLEQAAGEFVAAESLRYAAENHEEGSEEVIQEKATQFKIQKPRIKMGEKEIGPEHVVRILHESLGPEGGKKISLVIPTAFVEIMAGQINRELEQAKEYVSRGGITNEEAIDRLEDWRSRFQRLFATSLQQKNIEQPDYQDLMEWVLDRYEKLHEIQKLPSFDQARKKAESALRADLPLFERFLQKKETKDDYDLLMSTIEGEVAVLDDDLQNLFLHYAASKDQKIFEDLELKLQNIIELRKFLFLLTRKKLGE